MATAKQFEVIDEISDELDGIETISSSMHA